MKETKPRSQKRKTAEKRPPPQTILTLGHSILPIEDFLALLKAHSVERLFDIRTIPRSRRNPQFNQDALQKSLEKAGIEYVHVPALGGLRHANKDSTNTGWKNPNFRGYADYMQTPEFDAAIAGLIQAAADKRSAIMCAEAVPWKCHRSLVSDALTARNIPVEHIMGSTKRQPHSVTPFAQVRGTHVTYPATGESGTLDFG
jgi:uncharacterized protein (DUF488 family)